MVNCEPAHLFIAPSPQVAKAADTLAAPFSWERKPNFAWVCSPAPRHALAKADPAPTSGANLIIGHPFLLPLIGLGMSMWYHFGQFNPGGHNKRTSGESLLADKERSCDIVLSWGQLELWQPSQNHERWGPEDKTNMLRCQGKKWRQSPEILLWVGDSRINQPWRHEASYRLQCLCSKEPPSSLSLSVSNSNRHAGYTFLF